MNILIASAELSPLARTGGLGEAVAGFAHALARSGHNATVALPRYRHLQHLGSQEKLGTVSIWRHTEGTVTVLLVDDPDAFDRPGIYGPRAGAAYDDQWWRFGRFSATVRKLAAGFDILHIQDNHPGPAALDAPVPTIFTIHNAAYSISGPAAQSAAAADLPPGYAAPLAPLEWFGETNFLKAAIVGSNQVTTVSPTFAKQIMVDPDVSSGMDRLLEGRNVTGIVNGIDTTEWDWDDDPRLPVPVGRDLAGRPTLRAALLEEMGLADGIVFGNVGRMAEQKGLTLLAPGLESLIAEGARFVFVGNGELDDLVDSWVKQHPTAVAHVPFTADLAHLVPAGADAYLMPSRFEPCGIGQMYAMRYGSVPVVRLTGGLADTVIDIDEDPDEGTGLGFRPFLPHELTKTMRRAMRLIDTPLWRRMQENGMERDFSWDVAAKAYVDLYRTVV